MLSKIRQVLSPLIFLCYPPCYYFLSSLDKGSFLLFGDPVSNLNQDVDPPKSLFPGL